MMDNNRRNGDGGDEGPAKPWNLTRKTPATTPPATSPVLTPGNIQGDPKANTDEQATLADQFGTGFINYGQNKAQQNADRLSQVKGLPEKDSLAVTPYQKIEAEQVDNIGQLYGGPSKKKQPGFLEFMQAMYAGTGDKLGNRGY